MQVRDVMTPGVESVRPDETLQMAADRMRKTNVGALPVVDNGKVLGMITDRDIVVRAVAEGLDPRTAQIQGCYTSNAVICHFDASIEDAAGLMESRQVRRLLVDDETGRIVGIISLGDIAAQASKEVAGEILREVSATPTNA